MKLELDDSVQDAIVVAALKESMKILKKNIKNLSAKKNREPHEEEDLLFGISTLDAMQKVCAYFGA
jgi:hypothetical protein